MDYDISQMSNFEIFFFYGEPGSDLAMEIESDLVAGCIQPKKSLFYNRRDAAGVPEKENHPNAFVLQILTKYDIVKWNAWRNTQVSDGTNGNPDRRIALSQSSIAIQQSGQNMDILVNYIPFSNIKKPANVSIPMNG